MDFVQRWLLMIAVATTILGVSMLVLRVNVRTAIIFYVIGLSVITLWMIVDERYFSARRNNIREGQACSCPICKHDVVRKCIREKCACCLVRNNGNVTGHK